MKVDSTYHHPNHPLWFITEGSKVILGKPDVLARTSYYIWVPEMDQYVGTTVTVKTIIDPQGGSDPTNVWAEVDGAPFVWPLIGVKPVGEPTGITYDHKQYKGAVQYKGQGYSRLHDLIFHCLEVGERPQSVRCLERVPFIRIEENSEVRAETREEEQDILTAKGIIQRLIEDNRMYRYIETDSEVSLDWRAIIQDYVAVVVHSDGRTQTVLCDASKYDELHIR